MTDIKKLRQSLGLSQVKFAEKIGVVEMTVRRWEHGQCKPSSLAREKLEQIERGT